MSINVMVNIRNRVIRERKSRFPRYFAMLKNPFEESVASLFYDEEEPPQSGFPPQHVIQPGVASRETTTVMISLADDVEPSLAVRRVFFGGDEVVVELLSLVP